MAENQSDCICPLMGWDADCPVHPEMPLPKERIPVGTAVTRYADKAMYESEDMPELEDENGFPMPEVTLLAATPDPLGAIGAMCAMYEGRVVRSLSDLGDDDRRRYWQEVNATHLKAPLEAVDLMFLLEGVTRAFTHQLVRQRTAVFAQESMRFAVKHKISARPGPNVVADPAALKVWRKAMERNWDVYNSLITAGVPSEDARGVLPHDTLTRVIWKTNLKNLIEHAGNRLCTQAQFEWRLVMAGVVSAIREYDPPRERDRASMDGTSLTKWQFPFIAMAPIFRPVCFSTGGCPFKASFDRGCTIRERMDSGRSGDVRTEEWLADPRAGWVR